MSATAPPACPTPARWPDPGPQRRPADLDDLAFADVPTLGRLVRDRQVSCVELTELVAGPAAPLRPASCTA